MSNLSKEELERIEQNARTHAETLPPREYMIAKHAYKSGGVAERIRANEEIQKVKREYFEAREDYSTIERYEQSKLKDAKGEE